MGCCNDSNIKTNCGKKQFATCVHYKSELPAYSKLEKGCVVIEETTKELYENQENILQSIDTSKITKDCIDYPTTEVDGEEKILVISILQSLQDQICDMKEESSEDEALNLDFKCLTSPCGNQIDSLKDLLQVLINEICELKNQP